MKLKNPVSSILSELLSLIKTFSCLRHQILLKNLSSMDSPNYIPQDLPVTAFAEAMHAAINEYVLHQRLVFFDSKLIHFTGNGSFTVKRIIDVEAQALLSRDKKAYESLINNRLKENRLSEKATTELLNMLHSPDKNSEDQRQESNKRGVYSL